MMKLWRVTASISDDPYEGQGSAVVAAPNKTQAKKAGKEAILDAYWDWAGGWGTGKAHIPAWERGALEVEEIPFPGQTEVLLAQVDSYA